MAVTSKLTINDVEIDRNGAHIVTLQSCTYGMGSHESLDFTEECTGSLVPTWPENSAVTLSITDDSTSETVIVFNGRIETVVLPDSQGCIPVAYHCQGMRWYANQIITTNANDGTGKVSFNLDRGTPGWNQDNVGLTVGDMIYRYLTMHSDQLTALGLTLPTDPSTDDDSDLVQLSVVPLDPVNMYGRVMDSCETLLTQWCNKYQMFIDPNDLRIRVVNLLDLPQTTLTLGTDPTILRGVQRDQSDCATKVILRGSTNVAGAVIDDYGSNPGLTPGWDPDLTADFSPDDYMNPTNSSAGTIDSMTSDVVTVTPDGSALIATWDANYWNGATLWAGTTAAGDVGSIAFDEQRLIVACTARSTGSCDVTLEAPFENSGYDTFTIRGKPIGKALVYRKYDITDTDVSLHLLQSFGLKSFNWNSADGAIVQTNAAVSEVFYSPGCPAAQNGFPGPSFQIIPSPDGTTPGYILFDQPTYKVFGRPPCRVLVVLPYSLGVLKAETSGWQGTAYTTGGLQRTLYRDYPSWVSGGDRAKMATLAGELLDTVKNTVIEGAITHYGIPIGLMGVGQSLNLASAFGATGLEDMASPIRQVHITWPKRSGAAQEVAFQFSNKRKPFCGDRLYVHPTFQRSSRSNALGAGAVFQTSLGNGGIFHGSQVDAVGGAQALANGEQTTGEFKKQQDQHQAKLDAQNPQPQGDDSQGAGYGFGGGPAQAPVNTYKRGGSQKREAAQKSAARAEAKRASDSRKATAHARNAPATGPKITPHMQAVRAMQVKKKAASDARTAKAHARNQERDDDQKRAWSASD